MGFNPLTGEVYLTVGSGYYPNNGKHITILHADDIRIYWSVQDRENTSKTILPDGTSLRYYDAIDRQYFTKWALRAGLVLVNLDPSWEI